MILTRSRPTYFQSLPHLQLVGLADSTPCEAGLFKSPASTLTPNWWDWSLARTSKRDGSRVLAAVTVHTVATRPLLAFRFNCGFELSALQDQRLQFTEWPTCQTGYFGDVSGTATRLQCPFGIHTSTKQHELPARYDQRLLDMV